MKRFVSVLLFMSVFFTMFASVGQAAAVIPKIFLNGQQLKSEINPQIINNSTVVPVRTVSEGLGYQIEWDNTSKTATVTHTNNVIKLKLNDNVAIVNDQKVKMDTSVSIIKGYTLVPLRFIGEQFGLNFEWKPVEKEVHMFEQPTKPIDPVDPTNPVDPSLPIETKGSITNVYYEGGDSLSIYYDGEVKASKPMLLDNPKRIVFDFPNASYSSDLSAMFVNGQAEVTVSDSTYLQGFRYSLFSNTPETARLVILVSENTGYVMKQELGRIQFNLMSQTDVPVDPPVQPPVSNDVFDVVIDAGHGGSDPGAKSILNKWEKEFTLSIALKMKALLEKESKIKVHLTRTGDTYPSLDDRVKFAENLKADLFMSIHANSGASSVTGAETYYYRDNSKALATIIQKRLLVATKTKDRGVKKEGYKVIKQTTMPAVLVEAGFLTNTNEAKMLFDDASQNRIAAEMVAGIKEFLKVK